ncbi:MAG: hypothetical protein IPG61_08285 [bacterium]|nr:hypothetical protein [bacterium]
MILKLADRIANVEAATAENQSHLRMYRKEHEEFKAGLTRQAPSDVATLMWEYLDHLLVR